MKRHGKAMVMCTSVPCDSQNYPDKYLERYSPKPVEAGTRSTPWPGNLTYLTTERYSCAVGSCMHEEKDVREQQWNGPPWTNLKFNRTNNSIHVLHQKDQLESGEME